MPGLETMLIHGYTTQVTFSHVGKKVQQTLTSDPVKRWHVCDLHT